MRCFGNLQWIHKGLLASLAPFFFAGVALVAAPALSGTYALVVGIDQYEAERNLEGAVADARHVAQALRDFGADEVALLLDRQASREAIEGQLLRYIDKASPGDSLIFTYAGHGAQAPEAIAGSEADGLDEFFLLSRFNRAEPDAMARHAILDNDIRQWLLKADEKGIRTIFVADSCHSGGMTRNTGLKTRLAAKVTVPVGATNDKALAAAKIREEDFTSTLFLSASLESQPTPEVLIEGTPRGALSYAFAQSLALKGVDGNRDGQVEFGELANHVVGLVKAHAENLQIPDFAPQKEAVMRTLVFEKITPPAKLNTSPDIAQDNPLDITLALESDSPLPPLSGTSAAAPVRFSWDASEGRIYSPMGDLVASGLHPDQLQQVVDKFRLLEHLKKSQASNGIVPVHLFPRQQLYLEGDILSLAIDAAGGSELVLFNLTNAGSSQYLGNYALEDGERLPLGDFIVTPPFGADHIVAVALGSGDAARLEALLSQPDAPNASQLLLRMVPYLTGAQVGIQPFYTEGR